jgi:hypothetical protein
MAITKDWCMSEQNIQDSNKVEPGDWLLRVWIKATPKKSDGFSVVLTTAAGIISGILISEANYLESISSAMADGWGGSGEGFRDMFSELTELENSLPLTHIHLRDAKIVTLQGAIPVGVNGLWRGDLNAIIGHSIGQVTMTPVA